MKRIIQICILLALIPVITLCIARSDKESLEEQVLLALTETADYLSSSIIDENGI